MEQRLILWRAEYRKTFQDLLAEVDVLLNSAAKYLDPALAMGKGNGVHLYQRYAESLSFFRKSAGIVGKRKEDLPSEDRWIQTTDDLHRETLQELRLELLQLLQIIEDAERAQGAQLG